VSQLSKHRWSGVRSRAAYNAVNVNRYESLSGTCVAVDTAFVRD
jgi:hypothetical protein